MNNTEYPPWNTDFNTVKILRLKSMPFMRSSIITLFSRYGTIIELITSTNNTQRITAFITYPSTLSAQNAAFYMDGYRLYGRELNVTVCTSREIQYYKLISSCLVSVPRINFMNKEAVEHPKHFEPNINHPSSDLVPRNNQMDLRQNSSFSESLLNFSNNPINSGQNLNISVPVPYFSNNQMDLRENWNMPATSQATNYLPPMSLTRNDQRVFMPPGPANMPVYPLDMPFIGQNSYLLVTNVPGHNADTTYFMGVSLFNKCNGFKNIYIVKYTQGAIILKFDHYLQAQAVISFFSGLKIDGNLRLQLRYIREEALQYIYKPDFNPIPYCYC